MKIMRVFLLGLVVAFGRGGAEAAEYSLDYL